LAVAFVALALTLVAIAFCMPPLFLEPNTATIVFVVLIGVAIGLLLAAVIMFLIWLFICPKPCGWGALMAGQIFVGFGWGAMYFFSCCLWLGSSGLVAFIIGIGLLALWWNECRPTFCTVIRELGWVVLVAVPPVVAVLLAFIAAFAVLAVAAPPPLNLAYLGAVACASGASTVWGIVVNVALTLGAVALAVAVLFCSESE
jgi:hypothetical protein